MNSDVSKSAQRSFIAGNFVKAIIFCLISVLLVVGNFFLEARFASGEEILREEFSVFDYSEENFIPNRGVIRDELADLLNAKKENIIIETIDTTFGVQKSNGYAKVYSSLKTAEGLERKHILKRNKVAPKKEKKEEEKKEEAPAEPAGEAKQEEKPEEKPEEKKEEAPAEEKDKE